MTQDAQHRWTIDELMPGGAAALDGRIARLEGIAARIEGMRPLLAPGIAPDDFARLLAALEEFAHAAGELQGYGELWFSGDMLRQEAQAFLGRVEQVVADLGNRVLFFSLWWRALDDGNAARLMGHAGDLRYYLAKERLMSRHTLSEPEEKVINLKDVNGVHALVKVYDLITNKFSFTLEVDGETKTLTRDALAAYVRHPSAQVREAAYREQYRPYGAEAAVLGQIYVNRVRDWAGENLSLRSFRAPIDVRNLANDIPGEVVSTLLGVCEEEAPVFQRYFTAQGGVARDGAAQALRPLRPGEREVRAQDSVRRGRGDGHGGVLALFGRGGDPRPARLRVAAHRQRGQGRQAGRGVLLQRRAGARPLGADQLHGRAARGRHARARTRARPPFAAGPRALRAHASTRRCRWPRPRPSSPRCS